ncbi:NmrA domain-containing protein [Fusarium sp. LHS14.1]|nr:NmrA domain-containing protein [Fusarium sp. LHS14.1]
MVKIAIAGGSSELASEVLDKLVATGKHEITALVRKDPSQYTPRAGVRYVQVNYQDKAELAQLLKGIHTVLSFIAAHLDPENQSQKNLIDASVEAGVTRFAPSEWSTGVKIASSLDAMPWYAGKVEVAQYLEDLNKDKKVLQYTRFQVGSFMDYLCHPYKASKYITTLPINIDLAKKHAIIVEGSLDDEMTYTSADDIAHVVARAVDYEGEWPVIGGIQGDKITIGEVLKIGEKIRGEPFTIEWLKMEDLAAGELKTDNYPRIDLPSIPKDQVESFSKGAIIGVLIAMTRGVWTVSDEWNKIFPDYKFTKVEELLKEAWKGH